jgi:hypothetical protein
MVGMLMLVAFMLSKFHHFREYWYQYNRKWKSAHALLESTVCQQADIRMRIGEFDNCYAAESFVTISPLHRAIHSVAEELHVCGNDRCAILYMDITDKLPYLFAVVVLVSLLLILKFWRDWQHQRLVSYCAQFRLPTTSHKKEA